MKTLHAFLVPVLLCSLPSCSSDDEGTKHQPTGDADASAGGAGGSGAPGGAGGASPGTGGATAAGGRNLGSDGGLLPDASVVPEGGTGSTFDCCSSHPGIGCKDVSVEACVCAEDPRCCTEGWTEVCAALVNGLECGVCKTDCCVEATSPGCADPVVEECVCGKSPECCTARWDAFCVQLVESPAGGSACGACE